MTRTGKLCACTLITLVTEQGLRGLQPDFDFSHEPSRHWLGGNCVAPTSLCRNSLGSLRVEFDSQFQPRSGGCL
jgi:hypothetical protein